MPSVDPLRSWPAAFNRGIGVVLNLSLTLVLSEIFTHDDNRSAVLFVVYWSQCPFLCLMVAVKLPRKSGFSGCEMLQCLPPAVSVSTLLMRFLVPVEACLG